MSAAIRSIMKPSKCKGCGRPVRETAGKAGYCKRCIRGAREAKAYREENGNGQ